MDEEARAERRRPRANVAPIPSARQLWPIASPCRFERFQALVLAMGVLDAPRRIGPSPPRLRCRRNRRRPAAGRRCAASAASASPVKGPSGREQARRRLLCTIFLKYNNTGNAFLYLMKIKSLDFERTAADRYAPRSNPKPRGRKSARKPRSPPSEHAMNSAPTGNPFARNRE